MDQKYLKEAIRIGDGFIEKSLKGEVGIYWKTLTYSDGNTTWKESESIYSGVSGIALFLMELFEATKEEKYLHAAEESLLWCWKYHEDNPTDYYALFTGRLGLAYVFSIASDITGKEEYLKKAIVIALESGKPSVHAVDDLINGAAGTLIGLLILHQKSKDDRLIEKIEFYTSFLIDRGNFGNTGIYWDRGNKQTTGLCGFSHGTSGIGYAFLQLGKYFNNSAFYFLAEMAFAYENQYFKEDWLNWPDFRKGYFDEKTLEEFKLKYKENDLDYFNDPGSMKAWCHGSPGVGLSRIAAYKILGDRYLPDLENAVDSTIQSLQGEHPYHTYTLCHGVGGNSLLLAELTETFPEKQFDEELKKVGDKALRQIKEVGFYPTGFANYKEGGETSLFMGDAGIGYVFLKLFKNDGSATILKPEVEGEYQDYSKDSILSITLEDLKSKLVNKVFPETISKIDTQIDIAKIGYENTFGDIVEQLDTLVDDTSKFVLEFEKMKNELEMHPVGLSYLHIKRVVEIQRSLDLLEESEETLHKAKFYLPSENKIFTDGDEMYRLIVSTPESAIAYEDLGFFAYLILSKFEEPSTIEEVVDAICSEFEVDDQEEIKKTVLEQTMQALKSGILYVQ